MQWCFPLFSPTPDCKGISTNMSAISFLNLPTEIRTEIYSHFFQPLVQHAECKAQLICEDARRALDIGTSTTSLSDPHHSTVNISPQPTVDVKEFLQLLLVCRLVYQESFPIYYNNVTFHVRKPLDFANSFLRFAGLQKLSQIRHLEIRLDGTPVGIGNWLSSPKLSRWNHHQVGMIFEYYPELECLTTLVIKIEKFAAEWAVARHAQWYPYPYVLQDKYTTPAWTQNRDTAAMMSKLNHLKLWKASGRLKRVFTVTDVPQVDELNRTFLKRIFTFTLWKTSEMQTDSVGSDSH